MQLFSIIVLSTHSSSILTHSWPSSMTLITVSLLSGTWQVLKIISLYLVTELHPDHRHHPDAVVNALGQVHIQKPHILSHSRTQGHITILINTVEIKILQKMFFILGWFKIPLVKNHLISTTFLTKICRSVPEIISEGAGGRRPGHKDNVAGVVFADCQVLGRIWSVAWHLELVWRHRAQDLVTCQILRTVSLG